jgi:hypothetical protein
VITDNTICPLNVAADVCIRLRKIQNEAYLYAINSNQLVSDWYDVLGNPFGRSVGLTQPVRDLGQIVASRLSNMSVPPQTPPSDSMVIDGHRRVLAWGRVGYREALTPELPVSIKIGLDDRFNGTELRVFAAAVIRLIRSQPAVDT